MTNIPDPEVAKRYGVCRKTLDRWDETPDLNFPPRIYIRKRRYRDEAALDEWDLQNSKRAAERLSEAPPRATAAGDPR